MAQYDVTAPDGTKFQANAPDTASRADVLDYAQQHYSATMGDPAKADQLADAEARDAAAAPTSQWKGFLEGVTRPAANIDRGIGAALKNATGVDDGYAKRYAGWQHATGQDVPANAAPLFRPGAVGRMAGEFVGAAPLTIPAEAVAGPLGGGAAYGALTSDADNLKDAAIDTGLGAAGSKFTDLGVKGVARTLAPKISPYVQSLLDNKIPLAAGQTMGGMVRSVEDKLTSWPFVGQMVKSAGQHKRWTEPHSL